MKKPSEPEDEFFAREDALKQHKLTLDKVHAMKHEEREALKKLHFMHCPKCGMELATVLLHGLTMDRCNHCNGTWLDEAEMQKLFGKEPELLRRVAAIFRGA